MGLKIKYPVEVLLEDGEKWCFDNENEMVCTLEWFDNSEPDEKAVVTDSEGKEIFLKIEALSLLNSSYK